MFCENILKNTGLQRECGEYPNQVSICVMHYALYVRDTYVKNNVNLIFVIFAFCKYNPFLLNTLTKSVIDK
jgi:hypothetical protein